MLLPLGNPFKCHEEVLSLQSMIPPKRFDIFPLTGGCSEGLDTFRVFFKHTLIAHVLTLSATCSRPQNINNVDFYEEPNSRLRTRLLLVVICEVRGVLDL